MLLASVLFLSNSIVPRHDGFVKKRYKSVNQRSDLFSLSTISVSAQSLRSVFSLGVSSFLVVPLQNVGKVSVLCSRLAGWRYRTSRLKHERANGG